MFSSPRMFLEYTAYYGVWAFLKGVYDLWSVLPWFKWPIAFVLGVWLLNQIMLLLFK